MTVSILIPVYNGSQTLTATLECVLNQSVPPDEVIIGDDTLIDNRKEVVKIKKIVDSFKKKAAFPVIFIKHKKNFGCQGNFQTLTDRATKDIVLYLAQDDIFSTNAIASVQNVFKNNPPVGFMTRPYFWFYDDIKKPIRHVPPPNLKAHTVITSATELSTMNDDIQIQKAVHAIFGSIGQISGLAMRRKWIKNPFHADIFPGHMYPIAHMWKSHPGIFIKEYILAVGTVTSQSRTRSDIYDDSPTEQWMRMFRSNFSDQKYDKILNICTKHITTNFVGLIQIKNFSSQINTLKEVVILLKYRWQNIFDARFWFYSVISIFVPALILRRMTDWYKNKIHATSVPPIQFKIQ